MRLGRTLVWVALAVYVVALVRSAWMCDDAYITLRTVRNFVAGDGPRWNLAERVQSYTHPLWMFALSAVYAVTREEFFSTIALSMAVSTSAVAWIGAGFARTPAAGATAILLLTSSRSFVDYSTSGLENPLTHALLLATLWIYLRRPRPTSRDLYLLSSAATLVVLNRMDTALLVAPIVIAAWWPGRSWRTVGVVALAGMPWVLWELFSIIYYGFPFPNTAYAKLAGSIGFDQRFAQGVKYLVSSFEFDRVAVLTIAAAATWLIARRGRGLPLGVGIVLYLLYVVSAGGDFMAGRFLTAPLVVAIAAIVDSVEWPPRWLAVAPAGLALALGLSHGSRASLVTGARFGAGTKMVDSIDDRGVADERRVYFGGLGLLRSRGMLKPPRHWLLERGRNLRPGEVPVIGAIGLTGWAAAAHYYIVDKYGLSDPLLARLPPIVNPKWRPGHLARALPPGYEETLKAGHNQLRDPALAAYYDELVAVTRGPIWSPDRWRAIWRLNTGAARPPAARP